MPPSQTFSSSLARSGSAITSCVGRWTTSSGIATSGAGGPSGLQSGRGGDGSRVKRRCPAAPKMATTRDRVGVANQTPPSITAKCEKLSRRRDAINLTERDKLFNPKSITVMLAASKLTRLFTVVGSRRRRDGLQTGGQPTLGRGDNL